MKVLFVLALVCVAAAVDIASVLHGAKRQTSPFVAFSAGLTQTQNITSGVNVKFDKVELNVGNGYDPTTGIFTVPTDGTYVLMYHGLSEIDGQLYLDLYKNNVYEVTAYAHNSGDYAAVSNSVVLTLVQGDQIHLQGRDFNQLYGATDEIYATFSGFELAPSTGGGN